MACLHGTIGTIYRPDVVGAQTFRVFRQAMNDRFIGMKIDAIEKICCSATDFWRKN